MNRYYRIDHIRAFVIINMIIYHAVWDMVYLLGYGIEWFTDMPGRIWQRFICIAFIMVSGFCWKLSRNHIKRGLIVFGGGIVVSVVTAVFMPEAEIRYGILTLIGSCVIIMIPFEKCLKYINSIAGFALSVVMYILFKDVTRGYIAGVHMPEALYKGDIMTYIGFKEEGFVSADYFPLLPWMFLFTGGYFLYRVLKENNMLELVRGRKNTFTESISRRSFIIYLIHQPVVYCVVYGVHALLKWLC